MCESTDQSTPSLKLYIRKKERKLKIKNEKPEYILLWETYYLGEREDEEQARTIDLDLN